MSYRIVFYVGHFVHDGNFAAIQPSESVGATLPELRKPLNECDARRAAVACCDHDINRVDTWDIEFVSDQLTFCEFSDRKAIAWILELVRTSDVDVIDASTMRVIPLCELNLMVD